MFASQSLKALKLDQQDILHNIIFNSPCNPFPKQVLQQLSLSDLMMKGCCKCMENRFSRFHFARLSWLLSITMLSNIWSFAFHSLFKRKLGQESNFTLLVRGTILNAIKLLFKQFSDCSQSSIFPSRSSALRHVHLKIKMASINGKTRYISTISRKNRAL